MQLSPTTAPTAPAPRLGVWIDQPQLAATRTVHRDRNGFQIDTVRGFDTFAAEVVQAWDHYGNGSIDANELRRTQQHLFGSNANGSTDPAWFVWPNTTVRQEVVSMEGLFAAAKGADDVLTTAELTAFAASFDANGNGYLDSKHHGDFTGSEVAAFDKATSPVIIGARQLTVEGKLEGVGHTIDDRWADELIGARLSAR